MTDGKQQGAVAAPAAVAGAVAVATAAAATAPDLVALKGRQQAIWASGDFGIIGTTLQIVGETLCEAIDLRAGAQVLDVAAGNGNCSLAAARRWCDVTSTDYVPALLADGRRRAAAERLAITFQEADVEALPFGDGSFDAVLSSFGVMFAPNHPQAAREMLRVCRPGGRIGLANWTPGGFVGKMLGIVGKYAPPPTGVTSPARWGVPEHVGQLFGIGASAIHTATKEFAFRYRSPEHFIDIFRAYYGPVHRAFANLAPEMQDRLDQDLLDLIDEMNVSEDATMVVPGEYLEVVVIKR